MPLVNQETDRLYLASPTGLVQCLHEIALEEPVRYVAPPLPDNLDAAAPAEGEAPADATTPEVPATPPETEPQPPIDDDPFGTAPADDAADADEDPFNP
jgi:hypothetical protein